MNATVLMLHHIEPFPLAPPPLHPNSYLARDDFAALLDDLKARHYRTVTLADAAEKAHLPRRTIVLTFDDGCRCFRDHALPELAARGMTATLFVVSGALGGTNVWDQADGERREDLLDAPALRELAAAGIEIGSHSRLHRDLSACSDDELHGEIAGSKADLETILGRPVRTFCYPYGRLTARAAREARAAGYLAAVSIHRHPGARPGDPWALPRMIVNPGESRFERRLKASGLYPLWSRLPRLGVLGGLRKRGTP
ncbi:MAG TPA: polysaccharide deacetylase family protein [Thermoanaerobaculia bacterium]|jgi:peptidoglycan/xylan/chitin deacetylase (PgdA/CDA1 family)|nr:polysaccharide deacetylase family protein [Thermoanaerobaculia bacterium]